MTKLLITENLITNKQDFIKLSNITEGVEFIRNVSIMGHPGAGWESHAEIKFNNVNTSVGQTA